MKKTFSVIYTICVVLALLGVIAFFGWKTYQSRQERISDFVARTEEYTRRLSGSIGERDVKAEAKLAEKLMAEDLSLVAVQVYSHDEGLRISVVKPIAGDYSRKPIAESDAFEGLISGIRFYKAYRHMEIEDMPGLEAVYVAAVLTDGQIRNNLMIILATVLALFIITLAIILLKPGSRGNEELEEDEEQGGFSMDDDFSADEMPDDEPDTYRSTDEEFSIPDDFDAIDNFDENDLLSNGPDFGNSLPLEDDFDLPNLDDIHPDEPDGTKSEELRDRLGSELERAASFNQDLSILLFSAESGYEDYIRESAAYPDLVFPLDGDSIAVIEINKDLDSTLAFAEDFIRTHIERSGKRSIRAGIASRNGRLISAQRLISEAESALRKTDSEKNIVAFRSDPEKYREYLKAQED